MDKLTKTSDGVTNSEALHHLLELIADVKVTMLTTLEADGYLRSRPMTTQDAEFDGALWFFSSDHDGKARELAKDPRVNLSYSLPDKQRYVSVSGLAEIVQDEDKKRELWKEAYRAWFPDGVDDPHCALLKVYVDKAEYWDQPSSRFVEIVGFTKAVLTGKPYIPENGHEKIIFDSSAGATNGDGSSTATSSL